MFCPSCTDEYRAGITECPECGATLVAALPQERWTLGPELVEVHRTAGHIDGEMVRSMLRANGIESMLTGEGEAWGQVYRLTAGPMADVRVWVTVEEAERARALIDDVLGETDDHVDPDDLYERPRGVMSSFVSNPIVRAASVVLIILLILFLFLTST